MKNLTLSKIKSFKLSKIDDYLKYKTNEKKILSFFLLLAVIFFLIGSILHPDPVENFSRTVEKFIKVTTQYNPEDAVQYTRGAARDLVMSQSTDVAIARANGLKTKIIDKVDIEILSQRDNIITARASVKTAEQWPGENEEFFIHHFTIEGERSGHTWKISNILEISVKKINDVTDN